MSAEGRDGGLGGWCDRTPPASCRGQMIGSAQKQLCFPGGVRTLSLENFFSPPLRQPSYDRAVIGARSERARAVHFG